MTGPNFGWDYPAGCTSADVDAAMGADEECHECGHHPSECVCWCLGCGVHLDDEECLCG